MYLLGGIAGVDTTAKLIISGALRGIDMSNTTSAVTHSHITITKPFKEKYYPLYYGIRTVCLLIDIVIFPIPFTIFNNGWFPNGSVVSTVFERWYQVGGS